MTPAEEIRARREAQVKRSRRIDALDADQLANFIHRLAAIVPGDIDRVLAEFDANAPRPRTEKLLHPVIFYGSDRHRNETGGGLLAYCNLCVSWHEHVDDGAGLAEFQRLVSVHSGIA